jgi:ABC-type uncharacterized transport system substrate-binding protein
MSSLPTQSRLKHLQRILVGLVCMLALGLPCSSAVAEGVLVVLSSKAAPYIDAAEACEKTLNKSGIKFDRVELSSLSAAEVKNFEGSVIAIGGRASALLAKDLSEDVHLYYCMTPNPEKFALLNRPNTSGIRTEIDYPLQAQIIEDGAQSVEKIGMLYRSSSSSSVRSVESVRRSIPEHWELVLVDLDTVKSESIGIKSLLKQKIDVVWTVLESIRNDIPVFGFSHALVRAGATFGVGISPTAQGEHIANALIAGSSDIHEFATPMTAINMIAAERIRLSFSKQFVRDADVVFEQGN